MPVQILKQQPLSELCVFNEVFRFEIDTYKQCAALWVSQLLSSAILAGSVALKLPQIFNIVWSGEVVGISPESFYSEVPLSLTAVMYNYRKEYPFLSYGETLIVLVQNFALVLILWKYMTPKPSVATMAGVMAIFAAVLAACFWIPDNFLYVLPLANFPLMIYSRVMQIISNYQCQTTGQLSSITTLLTFVGNLARIFTTIQQVGWDMTLIAGFSIGGVLSGILLFQILFYNLKPKKVSSDKKTE